jgi:hypothetical protein
MSASKKADVAGFLDLEAGAEAEAAEEEEARTNTPIAPSDDVQASSYVPTHAALPSQPIFYSPGSPERGKFDVKNTDTMSTPLNFAQPHGIAFKGTDSALSTPVNDQLHSKGNVSASARASILNSSAEKIKQFYAQNVRCSYFC